MDRRQQKTNAAILEAFETLLTHKSYGKITVQDIIDQANVGRTTFYAHFETKDALLCALCEHLFSHVFSGCPQGTHTHGESVFSGDIQALVCHILYHLRDNGQNIPRLLSGESSEVFQVYFRRDLSQTLVKQMLRDYDEAAGVPRDFLDNHITGSFVSMVQWWFRGGMKHSPEALAAWFASVTKSVL